MIEAQERYEKSPKKGQARCGSSGGLLICLLSMAVFMKQLWRAGAIESVGEVVEQVGVGSWADEQQSASAAREESSTSTVHNSSGSVFVLCDTLNTEDG